MNLHVTWRASETLLVGSVSRRKISQLDARSVELVMFNTGESAERCLFVTSYLM